MAWDGELSGIRILWAQGGSHLRLVICPLEQLAPRDEDRHGFRQPEAACPGQTCPAVQSGRTVASADPSRIFRVRFSTSLAGSPEITPNLP